MMTTHTHLTFDGHFDIPDFGSSVENQRFEDCVFERCSFSSWNYHRPMVLARNIEFIRPMVSSCVIGPGIIEDSLIDCMKTNDLFILWSTLFRHTTFRGKCGSFKLNSTISWNTDAMQFQAEFDQRRMQFYDATDWALDISQATFTLFEYEGIPSRVIRRDSSTQVIVTRERLESVDLTKTLSSQSGYWLRRLRVTDWSAGYNDRVLVAPFDRSRSKRELLLRELLELRTFGIADPD